MSKTTRYFHQAAPRAIGLVSMALIALLAGVLLYLSDRPVGSAWLIPAVPALHGLGLFGSASGWLPSFVHTIGFALLTAAALPARAGWQYGACLSWFTVDAAFELGQLPQVAPRLAGAIDDLFGPSRLGQHLGAYFMRGSFDVDDLAAAAGALCAAILLRLAMPMKEFNHAR